MKMDEYREEEMMEAKPLDLREYWRVLLKRKWTVVAFAVLLFAIVTIYSFLARPSYTARGTLLIEKEPNILTFEEVFRIETLMDDYYQTQFKLLQSWSLADNIIEKMKLQENAKFAGKPGTEKAAGGAVDEASVRSKLVEKFLGKLAVKPIRQTRLVEVQWKDNDPKFAAEVVNALFDSFIDMNVQLKYETTEQATEFLTKQIASLQGEIEEKQREMQKYGAEKNIIALSGTETTIIEKLGALNKALTEAQIDRLRKEAYYNEIKNAAADNIPDAMTNPLIQMLREDYARMSREYSKKAETFKPDYPEMQRLKTELESAKRLLENETNNLIKTAYSDYQAAFKRERSMSGAYNIQKQEAIQLNSNSIPYNSLKIEIENRKSLLESLIKRESETGVAARLQGLRTSNVRIVDKARPPLRPSSPRKKLNMLLALMMGLFGGVGLAFLFEYLDNSVKNHGDVEKTAGVATLGIVPAFSQNGFSRGYGYGRGGLKVKIKSRNNGKNGTEVAVAAAKAAGPEVKSIELIAHLSPRSNLAESYRTIRTSLLLSSADKKPKAIVVTSALPEEGKSATLSNLAVTLAQAGNTVLVVDSDFRKPTQHKIFKIRNIDGLTNYLTSEMELKALIKETGIPKLYLINVGPVPPNPAELLGSEKMRNLIESLKRWFDFILFDSPPVLTVSDAMVLGPKIDGMILVVWGGKTAKDALKQAKEKFDMLKVKCLGVVINNLSIQEHDYYYMHRHYHHYGEGKGGDKIT
jgi:capsular exopolysaccharide synthesis family protein